MNRKKWARGEKRPPMLKPTDENSPSVMYADRVRHSIQGDVTATQVIGVRNNYEYIENRERMDRQLRDTLETNRNALAALLEDERRRYSPFQRIGVTLLLLIVFSFLHAYFEIETGIVEPRLWVFTLSGIVNAIAAVQLPDRARKRTPNNR